MTSTAGGWLLCHGSRAKPKMCEQRPEREGGAGEKEEERREGGRLARPNRDGLSRQVGTGEGCACRQKRGTERERGGHRNREARTEEVGGEAGGKEFIDRCRRMSCGVSI